MTLPTKTALTTSNEQYKCIGLSTEYMDEDDWMRLSQLATVVRPHMVFERDTGWFIKLYNEADMNVDRLLSEKTNALIRRCTEAGYRMIEFDSDIPVIADETEGEEHGV